MRIRSPLFLAAAIVAGVLIALALALTFMDWNRLKGPIERAASARFGRPVTITGRLEVSLWSRSPTITVTGLTVGNPPWEANRPMLRIERAQLELEALPLFAGRLAFRRVALTHPDLYLHHEKSGRANWTFEDLAPGNERFRRPPQLPVVHDLVIESGRLVLIDEPRRLKLTGTVEGHGEASERDPKPFHIEGTGTINQEPFKLEVSGGPLRALTPQQPYPFSLMIAAGENRIEADGKLLKPFDIAAFELHVNASGRDLAELYYLTQVTLPNTPPFKVQADITRDGKRIAIREIAGTIGESDVSGTVSIDHSTRRPVVSADLVSHHLLLKDLAAVTGSEAGGSHALAAAQAGVAKKSPAAPADSAPRLFPDAHLQVDRLRAIDADVRFSATSVEAGPVPLTQLSLQAKLENDVLKLEPLRFDFAQGHILSDISIEGGERPPKVHAELRAVNVRLAQFKGKGPNATPPLDGMLDGRAVIDGTGDSVREVLSDARGRFTAIVPHGDIQSEFAELTGVDVAKGLGLLLTKSTDRAPVRCAAAQFNVASGVARAQTLLIDTQNVLIDGSGEIYLGSEKLDLTLEGHPKKPQLLRLRAPVQLRGQILQPKLHLETGHALKQGAVGAALATVGTPLAALLAFVDPGLAKDQDCAQLLDQTQEQAPAVRP